MFEDKNLIVMLFVVITSVQFKLLIIRNKTSSPKVLEFTIFDCIVKQGNLGYKLLKHSSSTLVTVGAQWLSGRVPDSPRPRGCGSEPHRHNCVVSLSKTHSNPCLVLVQPWKTHLDITEKL